MLLKNKVAVVTGSTGGLGPVVAERLYNEGCSLVLTYLDEKKLTALPQQLKNDTKKVLCLRADVTKEEDVTLVFNKTIDKFSDISILCNAVGGYMDTKPFTDLTLQEWNTMMERNLTACFLTCREAILRMKDKNYGRIINISAKPGLYPEAERGAYGVAKGGVAFLSRMLGQEFRRKGITINALAPSIIKTPDNESWGDPEEMKYWVTPEQLADMIVFLCKESSDGITGAVIEAYGGI